LLENYNFNGLTINTNILQKQKNALKLDEKRDKVEFVKIPIYWPFMSKTRIVE